MHRPASEHRLAHHLSRDADSFSAAHQLEEPSGESTNASSRPCIELTGRSNKINLWFGMIRQGMCQRGIRPNRTTILTLCSRGLLQLLTLRNPDNNLARPRQTQIIARDFLNQTRIAVQILHFLRQRRILLAQLLQIGLHLLNLALRPPHR